MDEKLWILPAVLLTLVNATLALSAHPHPDSLLVTLYILPLWMCGTIGFLLVPVTVKTLQMMNAGIERPTIELIKWVDWKLSVYVLAAMALAGMNQIAFLWLKPNLNIHIPFTADPLLADIDKMLFFGTDPWTLLQWINGDWSGFVYHPVWYFALIAALITLLAAPRSVERTAMILTYFLCWSVVGPLIHILLPAGGPIFYERLGYGDRFAGIDGGPETLRVAGYLWRGFTSGEFEIASGISAMPSLHVTMAVWTVLCVAKFKRDWLIPVAVSSAYVSLLSVSLGWHYAVDGIVGGFFAIALYYGLLSLVRAYPYSAGKLRSATRRAGV